MTWNWQQDDWPKFTYDAAALEPLEARFLLQSGEFIGAFRHVTDDDRDILRVELISNEALKTSEIEGEYLDRDSLQSSLRGQFGLATDGGHISPKERGISDLMVDLYRRFAAPLDHETLHAWHKMVVADAQGIETIGAYRRHTDPMQIISGEAGNPKTHFQAPPSALVATEMGAFVDWFNGTLPDGARSLPALARSGIAHLYFESIHPFEDGNGRIGRGISEKALEQNLGQPSLIALAHTIEKQRKRYYDMLEASNKSNEITEWLIYFAETVLEAQKTTLRQVDFTIGKARFYDRQRGQLNPRQEKVVARMFREGLDGFQGGLSAENYISITKASRATATRDLVDLVAKGALTRTGTLRYARYWLKIHGESQ